MHTKIISDCLQKMNYPFELHEYELLASGISGAHTYQVQLGANTAVLKVTLAASEDFILQRAKRELTFYQSLAKQLPLQTPQLLSSYTAPDFGYCFLLTAHQPIITWEQKDFEDVAQQLAHLHATFWQNNHALVNESWLKQPSANTTQLEIETAISAWETLQSQERLKQCFTTETNRLLRQQLTQLITIDNLIQTIPFTLCHGDCHMDNFLKDTQGNLIWADWQEVGFGYGPEDLSFFLQRGIHAGKSIPVEHMLQSYYRALAAQIDMPFSLADIEQVVFASELRTLLLQWPFYIQDAPIGQISNILKRIALLVNYL